MVAPSPNDRNDTVLLCVDPGTIRRILASGDVDRYAEFEGLVHGDVPGGTAGLMNTYALFRGLQRPMIDSGHDRNVLVYVSKPVQTYRYPVPHRTNIDDPTTVPAPLNSVFVAYANVSDEARDQATSIGGDVPAELGTGFAGLVYNWEWALESFSNAMMPANFENRYLERVW